jgi:hypothetical protein
VSERLFEIFDEYASAYARGERPSAEDFLARAGSERDQLAVLLDDYLRRAPVPPPSEDDERHLELLVADEPPLLVLRRERKLRREQVVELLRERLGLPPELDQKLGLRYHELETGQLEPTRVDRRIWDVLGDLLQAKVEDLVASTRPRGLADREVAFFRATVAGAPASPSPPSASSEPDEVDRLFGLA